MDFNAKYKAPCFHSRDWLPKLKELLINSGLTKEQADPKARKALEMLGKFDKKNGELLTTTIFLSFAEIQRIANVIISNPDGKHEKEIQDILNENLEPGIALFGRMMTGKKMHTIYAALNVAHSIAVNEREQQEDFFVTYDDLLTEDQQGASHLGNNSFDASVFYRYASVNLGLLSSNLGTNANQIKDILAMFLDSFVKTIPEARQASFAAMTPPSAILMVVREDQPIQLTNAFIKPIKASHDKCLITNTIAALDQEIADMENMYGDNTKFKGIVTPAKFELNYLEPHRVINLNNLIEKVLENI
jgi:CRISPR system Cascade subunit CasC